MDFTADDTLLVYLVMLIAAAAISTLVWGSLLWSLPVFFIIVLSEVSIAWQIFGKQAQMGFLHMAQWAVGTNLLSSLIGLGILGLHHDVDAGILEIERVFVMLIACHLAFEIWAWRSYCAKHRISLLSFSKVVLTCLVMVTPVYIASCVILYLFYDVPIRRINMPYHSQHIPKILKQYMWTHKGQYPENPQQLEVATVKRGDKRWLQAPPRNRFFRPDIPQRSIFLAQGEEPRPDSFVYQPLHDGVKKNCGYTLTAYYSAFSSTYQQPCGISGEIFWK